MENKVKELRLDFRGYFKGLVFIERFLGSIDQENENCVNVDVFVVLKIIQDFRKII